MRVGIALIGNRFTDAGHLPNLAYSGIQSFIKVSTPRTRRTEQEQRKN